MNTNGKPTAVPPDSPRLIGAAAVAGLLNLSKRTIQRLRTQGKLPKPVRFGGCVRWIRKEIEEWIAAGCPELSRWQKARGA